MNTRRPERASRPSEAVVPQAPPDSRIYAIGDIHGRVDLLRQLHRLIHEDAYRRQAPRNVVVYLGDYVDRGDESRAVIEERDKELSIYEVPVSLVENQLDDLIVEKLNLRAKPLEIGDWRDMLHAIKNPSHEVTVGVVGKYIKHNDAYKSIYESLDHAGIALSLIPI